MSYNKSFKVNRRRKKSTIWPVVIMLLIAILVSLMIAGIWQATSNQEKPSANVSSDSQASSQAESIASSQPETSSAPESKPEEEPEVKPIQGIVPQNERAGTEYFDDAVFVGDSITTGIELYGMMENTDVLAGTGINLMTIYTAQVVKLDDGSRITIMDGLKNKQYHKVYVMLGGNEVRDEAKEQFIKNYSRVMDDIRKLQPNALIYIQSITPVTKVNNYKMDNKRIDEFNQALLELCKEKDVYYVNVAECMKDENGMLPDAASPADGMHFGPEYYKKWFHYLMDHTVSEPVQDVLDHSASLSKDSSEIESESSSQEIE